MSSIVSIRAIWSPPADTVQSSSSAAIDDREISVRLEPSSSSVSPSFSAISSSVGARCSFFSSSAIARSMSRARARTGRGTQSSAIIDELRALDWVPRSVRARARDIERAIAELEKKLHRAPTDEEIAGKLGMTEEELGSSLTEISRSSIAALDELWTVSAGGDQVALIDTIEDTQGPDRSPPSRRPR